MGLFKNLFGQDRQILEALTAKLGVKPREARYDDQGRLTKLDLSKLKLARLPQEIGQLSNLEELDLDGNPLQTPPREIVQQGTKAILAYLRGLQ